MALSLVGFLLFAASVFCVAAESEQVTDLSHVPEFVRKVAQSSMMQRSLLNVRVQKFQLTNCGSSDIVKVNEVKISPDLKLTASVDVLVNMTAPISVDLQISKKMPFLGWTKIPCIGGKIGSCSFEDVCSLIPKLDQDQCPPKLVELGIPCSCPLPAKSYSVSDFHIGHHQRSVPSWMVSGSFNVRAVVKANGRQIACHNIFATVA